MSSPRRLTTAGCYFIAAAILVPVICGVVIEGANVSGSSTASVKSAIFESSPPNSNRSRASVAGVPTSPSLPPSGSTQPETKSFREPAAEPKPEIKKTEAEFRKVNDTSRDSFSSRNDTPSSSDVIWTTASHAEEKLRSTEIDQLVRAPEGGSNSSRSRPKVTSGSETGSITEFVKTTDYFSAVPGRICCSTVQQMTTTTDNYDYNNYNVDGDDDNDDDEEENGGGDEADKEMGDAEGRDDAYGYSDRGGDGQTYDDYRGGMMETEDAEGEGDGEGGGGGGGGGDESRTEYVYVTDNITNNDSQIAPENQDLQQQDSNSDYDDYSPSSDQSRDIGQRFRGGSDYAAESRDYHLGVEHRNFDFPLGEKISELRGGGHRGQMISLRWLEHHPINHFAIFLWLVAALAFVSILLLAYRFRHSVVNAMQCTRVNYKQGKRFGIEEANDLLSNAQV